MNREDALFQKILPQLHQQHPVIWGPGDDTALLAQSPCGFARLATVDQVILGTHFTMETSPKDVAKKLVRRNISDIAAMGGRLEFGLLTLALSLPENLSESWITEFYKAIAEESLLWNFPICGGDISKLPTQGIVATLSLNGVIAENQAVSRHSIQSGDFIFVTGEFGRSFPTQHHLLFTPALAEGEFIAKNHFATAMMDVTDGLLTDLIRMCTPTQKGAILETHLIPRRDHATLEEALNDGEDYELIFTVSPQHVETLISAWPFERKLTCIGQITDTFEFKDKKNTTLIPQGWCSIE